MSDLALCYVNYPIKYRNYRLRRPETCSHGAEDKNPKTQRTLSEREGERAKECVSHRACRGGHLYNHTDEISII